MRPTAPQRHDDPPVFGADHRLLSRADERELAERMAAGDPDARADLIRHNLRLVLSVAQRYTGNGLDLLDLVQEGCIGLMRACDHYEPARGLKFLTYATYWVRQAITRALSNSSRTIRMPVHLEEHLKRMIRVRAQLQQELGRDPSETELAGALGWDLPRYHQRAHALATATCLSLEQPRDDDDEGTALLHCVADPFAETEASAIRAADAQWLYGLLGRLDDRTRQILAWRYGLAGEDQLTLEQIGHQLGITRERVRQIEREALDQLRHLATLPRRTAA